MKTILKRIVLLITILIIWNIASQHVNQLFVPDPKTVFKDLIAMLKTGQLIMAIKYSFLRITIATFYRTVPCFLTISNSLSVFCHNYAGYR